MADQPLSGIRVVDLTHWIAGPYCTKLLADYGADVIKIERPGAGDPARTLGPFPKDIPHPEKSGIFLHLNTNKRSVALDLKQPEGRKLALELVSKADMLVESFQPGVTARLGLDYETLAQVNPNLVYTSISNYGQTGPYRDYTASELTMFAIGGRMSRSGLPERYPLKLGGNHIQYQAGNVAAMATMFAFYGRHFQNMGGQHLDISIYETQSAGFNARMPFLLMYQYNGERAVRGEATGAGYPQGYYPCADGYISITGGGAFFPRVARMLGHPEWAEESQYGPARGQMDQAKKEEFEYGIWLPWLLERTKQEVVEIAQQYEMLCGAVNTVDEVAASPQFAARGYFAEVEHPEAGTLKYPGAPAKVDGWWTLRRAAPLLGQHTVEVLTGELGKTERELAALRAKGII